MSPVRGPNNESYDEYYFNWSAKQQEFCKELLDGLNGGMREEDLRQLVQKVEKHYEEYYEAKDGAAKQDVLKMMHPEWRSPLENAFLWIGGWRPTMVFQLAYAQAGHHVEAELADFLNGLDTPTLASLSSKQMSKISNLQIQAHKAEEDIGHREAVIQQSLADHPLLTLAQVDGVEQGNPLSDSLDEKVKELEELMVAADELRFASLKEILRIMSTTQAAQYLVAAGQLHLAVREIGLRRQQESSGSSGQSQ